MRMEVTTSYMKKNMQLLKIPEENEVQTRIVNKENNHKMYEVDSAHKERCHPHNSVEI
jgi:hypothetical protein